MDSTTLLLNGISLCCGLYCLYVWVKLAVGKRLFQNGILLPKDKKISDCVDEGAYIAYLGPRLLTLALVTTVYGVFSMVNDAMSEALLPYPWNFIPLVAVFVVLVWYAVCNSKANKTYFNM